MAIEVSLIIINWNVREFLRENLARFFAWNLNLSSEVIVIDNASQDGSGVMVAKEFPKVELLCNEKNLGFAKAVNQGLKRAQGRVIILLNPDMLVKEGAVERTHQVLMDDRSIGVVGVRLVKETGGVVPSVRQDPTLWNQLAIVFKLPHVFPRILDQFLMKGFDYGTSQDVPQVRGSFFAFRRDVVDVIGPFDERFFLWFEEVDFCKRARKAGYRVRYVADAEAVDLVGRSFMQVPFLKKQKIFLTSLIQYLWKWL
jgi:GT2 family glycosyltransferase